MWWCHPTDHIIHVYSGMKREDLSEIDLSNLLLGVPIVDIREEKEDSFSIVFQNGYKILLQGQKYTDQLREMFIGTHPLLVEVSNIVRVRFNSGLVFENEGKIILVHPCVS